MPLLQLSHCSAGNFMTLTVDKFSTLDKIMSAISTLGRSVVRLCKQNADCPSFRFGNVAIYPRTLVRRYQSCLAQLPCILASHGYLGYYDLEGIANGEPNAWSRSLRHFCASPLLSSPKRGIHLTSLCRDKGIEGWSGKEGDFRDILDTLVRESIEEEDMGPVNSDGIDDEDDIFVSQTGKMLLFPWRLMNASREGLSDEQREARSNDTTKYPSVTTILQKTMSPESALALLRWEKFMIKKMGFPAFQKLKKEMFSEGHQLHDVIGHVLLHKPEEASIVIEKGIEGYWNSIKERLPELASDSPIVECHLKHSYLGYHGYADCITEYRGEPCLVEFKTSRKPKKNLSKCFDNPLQVAAYLGALNFDHRYQLQINQALLVITYKDGSPADLHHMTPDHCDFYWKKWLRRLQEYRELEGRQTAARL